MNILFDPGSTDNFIRHSLLQKLPHQKIRDVDISVQTIDLIRSKETKEVAVTIPLPEKTLNLNFFCLENISDVPKHDLHSFVADIPEEKIVNLQMPSAKVDILIGVGDLFKFLKGNPRLYDSFGILPTSFGDIICGEVPRKSEAVISCHSASVEELNHLMQKLWTVESLPDDNKTAYTSSELAAIKFATENLCYDPKKKNYTVRLTFKEKPVLVNNISQAKQRFYQLERKLLKQKEECQAYCDAIQEFYDNGDIEEVPLHEIDMKDEVYYLPHRGVFKWDRETTKCRIVFDASAKTLNGRSLNSYLHAGPALQPNIAHILIRNRMNKICVISDISRMYMQIHVHSEDRNYLRFLWRPPGSNEPFKVLRFTKLIFGATDAPFLSMFVVREHCATYSQSKPDFAVVAKKVTEDSYVDDLITSAKTTEEGTDLYKKVSIMMSAAGFKIHKWCSNDHELMKRIPAHLRAPVEPMVLGSNEENLQFKAQKTLGVQWNPKTDTFMFRDFENSQDNVLTKRSLASLSAKVAYDPLGLISPFVLTARQILKRTFIKKMEWDQSLDNEDQHEWQSWIADLKNLSAVQFPRHVSNNGHFEVHVFGDASESGFGACAYVRSFNNRDNKHDVNLLLARAKVAPMQSLTIPQLELNACVLATKLGLVLEEQLQMPKEKIFCYSDSMICLWWGKKNTSDLKTYVSNRVRIIQERGYTFSYVSTTHNPADIASRGCTAGELSSSLWRHGPVWLQKSRHEWPEQPEISPPIDIERQLRKPKRIISLSVSVGSGDIMTFLTRFEKLQKALRMVAYIMRLVTFVRTNTCGKGPITHEELQSARLVMIRRVQQSHFGDEFHALENNDTTKRLHALAPIVDQGVLRVGGRLRDANLSTHLKHPIILPSDDIFTRKLIMETHENNQHCSSEWTHSLMRESYWILKGRRTIQSVLKDCMACKIYRASPVAQRMADLPLDRMEADYPFQKVGVDYAGPIYVTNSAGDRIKGWICMFCCLVTRGVHLELVTSLTTEQFVMALKRMINRKGAPTVIYSDNATTFTRASKEIARLVSDITPLTKSLTNLGIQWHFIPPYSPMHGGAWERMVRSVKEPLRRVLGRAHLRESDFATVLTEVEGLINNRPLNIATDDPDDFQPITPALLLLGRPIRQLPSPLDNLMELPSTVDLQQRWRLRETLAHHFWRRWKREYLLKLQQRSKWTTATKNVRVGDIVIVGDDVKKRNVWPLGRITAIKLGRDGLVRTVTLRTPQGEVSRSIRQLYLLEGVHNPDV